MPLLITQRSRRTVPHHGKLTASKATEGTDRAAELLASHDPGGHVYQLLQRSAGIHHSSHFIGLKWLQGLKLRPQQRRRHEMGTAMSDTLKDNILLNREFEEEQWVRPGAQHVTI